MPTQTQPLAWLWMYSYLKTTGLPQAQYSCTYVLNEEVSTFVVSTRALVAAFAESEIVCRAIVVFEIKHPIGLCPNQTCMRVCMCAVVYVTLHACAIQCRFG